MFPCRFRLGFIALLPLAVAAVVIDQWIECVQRFQLGKSRLPLMGTDSRRRVLQCDVGGFAMLITIIMPHARQNVFQQRSRFLRSFFQHSGGFIFAVQRHQQFRQRQRRCSRLARIPQCLLQHVFRFVEFVLRLQRDAQFIIGGAVLRRRVVVFRTRKCLAEMRFRIRPQTALRQTDTDRDVRAIVVRIALQRFRVIRIRCNHRIVELLQPLSGQIQLFNRLEFFRLRRRNG